MKNKNSKAMIIGMSLVLVIICLLGSYLLFMTQKASNDEKNNNNSNNNSFELKELASNNMLSLYIQNDVGSQEYTETLSTSWPSGFIFNRGKSYCIDEDGNEINTSINLNYKSSKVYVSNVTQTAYCFLYSDYAQSGLTFYLHEGKNSTTNDTNVSWHMEWTVSDPVSYCVTTENSSTNCTWTNFPSDVNSSYSSNITLPNVAGNHTYYGFLKDSSGNIYSDSDNINYNPIIIPPDPSEETDPKPSGTAPTCTLSISGSGVTLTKSENTTQYGLVKNSQTETYNSVNFLNITNGTYYGFVKNDYGVSSCSAEVVSTYQNNSSSTTYTWNESTCKQTGSTTSSYSCCKAATSTSTSGSCPSGMTETNSTSFCGGKPCCRSSSSIATPTTNYSSWTQTGQTQNSTSCTGSSGDTSKVEITNKKTKYNWSVTVLCKCSSKPYTNTGTSDSSYEANSACYASIDHACTTSTIPSCNGTSNSPSCSVTQSTTCTRTTYTRTVTGHSCSNGQYYQNGCYNFAAKSNGTTTYSCPSGDSKSGSGSSTQCCRTSSTQLTGYSCKSSGTTPTYGWVASGSGSGSSCPSSSSTSCNSSNVGSKQISNCESHTSGGIYYYCNAGYSKINDYYCYKIF